MTLSLQDALERKGARIEALEDENARLRIALEEYACACRDALEVAANKRKCFERECGATAAAALKGEAQ